MNDFSNAPNIPVYRNAQLAAAGEGNEFSQADLLSASINPEQLGKLIMSQNAETVEVLLAAILRNQKKNNASFQPVPYSYSTYRRQKVLNANPLRSYFLLQNVSPGDIFVMFEDASANVTDFTTDTQTLIANQIRAIRIIGGGYFEPLVAPTNPITLFTLNAAAYGVVVEGQ